MIINTFSIDWLHANEPFKAYALLGSFLYDLQGYNRLSPHTPRYGYTEAAINQAGAVVMRNISRSDMGVHIGYSGKTLNTYRENGVEPLDIVRGHLRRHATVSRIDLAFDVRNSTIRPEELYALLHDGLATTKAKSYNLIVGNDGGATCYIGSRSSEAFLRIYDKGVESGTRENWIRIELELKTSKAQFAAYTMTSEPRDRAFQWAQSWLKGFVDFPVDDWQALMNDAAIPLTSANKPERDTRKWLIEQVAPAMARYMNRTGDYKLLSDFMAILSALEDKCV